MDRFVRKMLGVQCFLSAVERRPAVSATRDLPAQYALAGALLVPQVAALGEADTSPLLSQLGQGQEMSKRPCYENPGHVQRLVKILKFYFVLGKMSEIA